MTPAHGQETVRLANRQQKMMARVAFGLRGMWLPLFFQLMSNICFVCFNPNQVF